MPIIEHVSAAVGSERDEGCLTELIIGSQIAFSDMTSAVLPYLVISTFYSWCVILMHRRSEEGPCYRTRDIKMLRRETATRCGLVSKTCRQNELHHRFQKGCGGRGGG